MVSEVGNALWRKARMGEIARSQVGVLASAVTEMAVYWAEDETLSSDAVRLAVALDRPVYDCVYLALAHRINGTLVTADERFANALSATEHGGAVVMLNAMGFSQSL
jgi:predicted nucleic acid-binding protein